VQNAAGRAEEGYSEGDFPLIVGRWVGVDFGPVDYVKYAEAFGATGFMIKEPDDIGPILKKAFDAGGPVIVGVHVDYRDNHKLFEMVHENSIH
jgi:acetolactate synthase I/II/III large subunit